MGAFFSLVCLCVVFTMCRNKLHKQYQSTLFHLCKPYRHTIILSFTTFYILLPLYQVKDDDLTAVYVNLPRSRQKSVSSFPSPSAWGISEPAELQDTLGSEGWETHTDEESGKEYYYHPSTGRSTWDYPLSPSMDSEVGTNEFPLSPVPSLSPACSPTDETKWTSDWEKVLDEKSGRHYFFNPVSGQSSWDPPDDLLTPPLSGNSLQEGAPV